MYTLGIDIETYSSADLAKTGVYKYVEAPDFEIMLMAYCVDGGEIGIVDLACGEQLPDAIYDALEDPAVLKTAYNANFERVCIAKHFSVSTDPAQWECTMAKASMLGLPLGLDMTAKALQLNEGKSASGKALIRYFSIPCKPTKVNGQRSRNLPEHDSEKWEEFKKYCCQDVNLEQQIRNRISFFTPPPAEVALWQLDQRINDTGVLLDPKLVQNAIKLDQEFAQRLGTEAISLTGLDNPNSVAQLKKWMEEATGEKVASLNKEVIEQMLKKMEPGKAKRVLQIRQEMAKTSVKKYEAMAKAICADQRVRGLLQYYGANRTGRWAGRLVQVQNLPQNHFKDLDLARQLASEYDSEMLELLFGNVPNVLSQLIRTAFVASPGNRFIVADFSAIEARVIAWLAGEKWRNDVFRSHGKIYEASAAQMFKVDIDSISHIDANGKKVEGPNYHLRAKGKIAELALGYGGGPAALEKMGALKNGLQQEELPILVNMWRSTNKAIVKYWEQVEEAAMRTIYPGEFMTIKHGIQFTREKGALFIALPSGRKLSYLRPDFRKGRFGGDVLTYEGIDQTTKQWGRQETYGGKLVENIVQAVARDCLADAMLRIDKAGYKIILHIHDEVVIEAPEGKGSLQEVLSIMKTPISWAKDLPLGAEGFETKYYKKQ